MVAILCGHTDIVNVVKFLPSTGQDTVILSGSADKTIRIWHCGASEDSSFQCVDTINAHDASINCIAVLAGGNTFASGAADGTVKIWKKQDTNHLSFQRHQEIVLRPRYFPLSIALSYLDGTSGSKVLAVGGTNSAIHIYVSTEDEFQHSATLTGHEGWIRSLAFTNESLSGSSDLLLASASQDKYIRLWRIHRGFQLPAASRATQDPALGVVARSLSNKAHRFHANSDAYSVTFEALLLGHDDWIYTVQWHRLHDKPQLLSASADNSLAIWEADSSSGIWICSARLGEISVQKGSTTATGSTGGFWTGLWSPSADAVASLDRGGSWRLWKRDTDGTKWAPQVGISGHTKEVKSITWSRNGAYLLSTSLDQTTRLLAQAVRNGGKTWHEFSRPQIHGYDLNCIDTISDSQFISGADEKLLRVFTEPAGVAELLHTVCRIPKPANIDQVPEGANMPVLGLSNKAIEAQVDEMTATNGNAQDKDADAETRASSSSLKLDHPPFEDHLARHTLWPETEKLYGHGYEISCCVVSHDGSYVATACRASSIDHAVIRLYETTEWRQLGSPLRLHSLTVTNLEFSPDDRLLLSVGRDRQWAVFERTTQMPPSFELRCGHPKGHSRMILDSSWAPSAGEHIFATAGRDKCVKLWRVDETDARDTISASSPVTAVSFLPRIADDALRMAYGLEDGSIFIHTLTLDGRQSTSQLQIDSHLSPSKSVSRLAWRPLLTFRVEKNGTAHEADHELELAAASEDATVRIYYLKL